MRKTSFGIVLSLVLVAGACGSDDGGADGEGALAAYYDQEVEWGACGSVDEGLGAECATVQVPIDYDDGVSALILGLVSSPCTASSSCRLRPA